MSRSTPNEGIKLSVEIRLAVFFLVIFGLSLLVIPDKPVVIEKPVPIVATSSMEINRGDVSKKQVIFTFDGGGENVSGEKIIETLNKHRVSGDFFLTGRFIQSNPNLVKKIDKEGHKIYNHTDSHPYMTTISNEQIVEELEKTEKVLQVLIGKSSKPYFRPPFGNRDQRVLDTAFLAGYQSVYWTIDAMDWQESEGRTDQEVKDIVLNNLASGNIYLMHIGDTITGRILDELFTEIKSRGYNIVSLEQGI
jgi:peptidoglycan/xylan/chitin deacetylase (PgdA/CDA1 family)